MGANATTTVPVYVSGEVLTAADLNITNSGIPVFAGTAERDAAFGGTGEKTLAEGQYAYLESTNATQFYDGANWQAVGVNPGLVCVKAETAFSAVSSVTADNVFTSSYTNYLLLVRYTTTAANLDLKLRVGGSSASSNYNLQATTISGSSIVAARYTAQSIVTIGGNSAGSFISYSVVNINGPQLAESTNFIMSNVFGSGAITTVSSENVWANHSTATAYDGIEILVGSGTTTGVYSIYGYSKTV